MTWQETLGELFAASVNEQTLEEAVEEMVLVSEDNPEYHERCLRAIDNGINAARSRDNAVVGLINLSGYQVDNTETALELLIEFQRLYLDEYQQATQP